MHITDIAAWCNIDFSTIDSNPLDCAKNLYLNGELVTNLVIPDGVTKIKLYAFENCSSLTSVTIPNSVTTIGYGAFYNCTSLTNVTIGNSVTSIENRAFQNCSSLTSIEIPNSVTSIGEGAFIGCTGLTSIEIPNSVTSIGDDAFYNCSSLTSVTIPNSVTTIGYDAFYNCTGLTNVTIGNSVTTIEQCVFEGCSSLANIVIGKGLAIIKSEAFKGCPNFVSIYLEGTIPPIVGDDNFTKSHYMDATVYVPIGSLSTYQTADTWKNFWNIQEYSDHNKVRYYIDGEEYASYTVKFGDAVPVPEVFAKEGYTFSWMNEIPKTMPAHDITIEGTFSINIYTVTYTVDGETYATDSIAYGHEIILRDEPSREGHTFSGWSEAPTIMPANDISIEGTFSVNNYTITYIIDGEVYETATIEYGAKIELPSVPEKEGYTFSWMNEIPKTMPAKDIVIHGSYVADTAIEEIYLEFENIKVYNLRGLRIIETDKLTRGVYIINGKKTFVK